MGKLMYAQMGLSAIESIAGYAVSREQAKLDRAVQAYNNTLSALSAAQSKNVITQNELQAQDAATRAAVSIQQQLLRAEGNARVASGSAGVAGGSVNSVMQGLRSSAARADYAASTQLQNQYRAFNQERRNVAVAQATNKDVSVIPKVSAVSAALGIGTDMLEIWDKHQAPGERIRDRLAGEV